MAVEHSDDTDLSLRGLIHTVMLSRTDSDTDSDMVLVNLVPKPSALLDREDLVALRDWVDAILTPPSPEPPPRPWDEPVLPLEHL